MSKMLSKYLEKLTSAGYCDIRGAAFCATATKLPGGEYGMVLLCVKGNALNIYDVDMKSNPGELLYSVELKNIENLKMRMWLLSQVLKFDYEGYTYSFTNFYGVRPALDIIAAESQKK